MSANTKRILLWSLLGLILAATLVWAFIPKSIPVDLLTLEPGKMTVTCLLYTSPSPRDRYISRMPSSA